MLLDVRGCRACHRPIVANGVAGATAGWGSGPRPSGRVPPGPRTSVRHPMENPVGERPLTRARLPS
ncbi:hypothetical protein Ae406Ps2_1386 [Pseudonocardia sp. Ae406_Ps2]|nr:hypothetical protein Ae406Ps2_1386 [Pseudonocardia sp. Ae406_Ps2]OLM06817.1 hypothetical protein Ae331Ps2_4527c [Pseudonocardia sp. Ae331_Ps2]OLM14895.1 hypothetical protein Ae505Ps2_5027 [Pseudonocardia sp. Ae505_Ps2]OLM22959.1 hypothetical protein Ae706Ps2_1391 [Pseudonocardia sp. Ae706_Ps2]